MGSHEAVSLAFPLQGRGVDVEDARGRFERGRLRDDLRDVLALQRFQ